MIDEPTELDQHRGMAAQKATDLRRLSVEVEHDQSTLRAQQEELESFLLTAPSANWADAVEKARYLLGLFAHTPAADDPRRQHLIQTLLADFERLLHE